MQSHSKLCVSSVSAPIALPGYQGWADLPDGPLHSILALSGSFRDLLTFTATCRSWRAAFSSYPSKSTFCTLFPPLLIQPKVRVQAPHLPSNNGHRKLRTCKVVDPVNQNSTLCCQIPQETYQKMHFAGTSYGQLICYRNEHFLVADVFTGAEVSPPPLPFSGNCKGFYKGTLTAPLASPDSHLIVSTQSYLFDWPVGSDSWSVLQLCDTGIQQFVELNGQLIAMDYDYKIYTLQLAPQLGLQEIATEWCGDLAPSPYPVPWLAACGDMLLMVTCFSIMSPGHRSVVCVHHHLDTSTNPAKWVELMKLDNWALFVGGDLRSPSFSCMSPERWGGRSKCLYYAAVNSKPWSIHGMGEEENPPDTPNVEYTRRRSSKLQPLWVYPSMFYSDAE